jgi:hypothetical protein
VECKERVSKMKRQLGDRQEISAWPEREENWFPKSGGEALEIANAAIGCAHSSFETLVDERDQLQNATSATVKGSLSLI